MATLHTSRTSPQFVTDHLIWSREGFDYLGGELDHAIVLLDVGEREQARAVLVEALRVMDRELETH